jgi:hypothetical protein
MAYDRHLLADRFASDRFGTAGGEAVFSRAWHWLGGWILP